MKKTFQFGICGAFDFEEKATGGQSVKTREFYLALSEKIGQASICILESTEYKKNPISFLVKFVNMMAKSENVVVFPAQKGIKIFAPLKFLEVSQHIRATLIASVRQSTQSTTQY